MLKSLALLAVVLTIGRAPIPASGQTTNNGSKNGQHPSHSTQGNASPAQSASSVSAQNNGSQSLTPKSEEVPNDHQQTAINITNSATASEWSWHDKIAWFFGLVLTGFLIAGVIVAQKTLKAIEEQTREVARSAKATEDAAKASLSQSNHMIASERAWVMAEVDFDVGGGLFGRGDGTQTQVELRIWNAGPTPAWVYEKWIYLRVSDEVIESHTQYQSPQFPLIGGEKSDVSYRINSIPQGEDHVVAWRAYLQDKRFATPDNGLHTFIFGVVRYRDAFASLRETYFGYVVKGNNRLERIPNEAYNKHT